MNPDFISLKMKLELMYFEIMFLGIKYSCIMVNLTGHAHITNFQNLSPTMARREAMITPAPPKPIDTPMPFHKLSHKLSAIRGNEAISDKMAALIKIITIN